MNINGPGKYNTEAEAACRATGAQLLLLIVIGGNKGVGFEVAFTDPKLILNVPAILRDVANEIEKQTKTEN